MKKKFSIKYKFLSLAILLSLGLAACEEFLDVNTDETRRTEVPLPLALSAAQGGLAFYMGLDLHLYSSVFSQQAAGNGVTGNQIRLADQYNLPSSDINNAWSTFLTGTVTNLTYVKNNAKAEGNPQYAGVSKIMEAYSFHIMTDAWGKIPFKQRMQGIENPQPAYDETKEIYDSLFVLIDSGLADLALENELPIGTDDLIYEGDIDRWVKFANTLKLRLALHYAKEDNGAKLNALIAAGGPFMESNDDNFSLIFDEVNGRTNPANQFELNRQDYYWPSAFIVDLMNDKADPRRTTYFSPVNYPVQFPYTPLTTDTYTGMVPGGAQSVAASRLHTFVRGEVKSDTEARTGGNLQSGSLIYAGDAPVRMLTYAEYNFIRSEAALVYGAPGIAADFFLEGITASMDEAALDTESDVARDDYMVAATVTAATLTLQNIIEEKYVANFMVCMEPWTDWRRTGFPVLAPTPAAVAVGNTSVPRIFVYPLSEQTVNAANLPARPSQYVKAVFWDK